MAHPGEAGLGKSTSLNVGVLKGTSGNVTKRLGTRRETRVTTQSKNVATTTPQTAAQERQAEKFRMQEWKRKMMAKFAHEVQVIRGAQAEEMEAQRQGFERKLSMMEERLELCEARSSSLTDEIHALKGKGAHPIQNLPTKGKNPATKKHKQQAISN